MLILRHLRRRESGTVPRDVSGREIASLLLAARATRQVAEAVPEPLALPCGHADTKSMAAMPWGNEHRRKSQFSV